MEPYPKENDPWKGSQSEQVLWYGEPHQSYQPYPQQYTMPVYIQPGQYQQPDIYQQQGQYQPQNVYQQPDQTYWNPNAGSSNQPFGPPMQNQQRIPQPAKARPVVRMPKAQAQALASNLKKVALVSSLAAFGILSALVAGNLQNTAATPSAPNQNQLTDPSQSNSDSNNYFHQGGGGYGFGNNGSGQNAGTSTGTS